jgi:glycosyltransferase involved in cell wall biosynthesis
VKGEPRTASARDVGARRARGGRRFPPIVWASPLPPTRSGVADYAAELLPELARHTTVTVLAPPDWEASSGAGPWADLPRLPWDAPSPSNAVSLLHVGNNPYHLWIARRLRERGGLVVLHDAVLHHLLVEEAAGDGAWERFAADLTEAHGAAGKALATARTWGFHGGLDPFLFPARSVYLRRAAGVIVHNRRAAEVVVNDCPAVPVRQVPLAVGALPVSGADRLRTTVGAARDELLVTHLGFLTPVKGLRSVLRGLAAALDMGARVRLLVVGEGADAESFRTAVRASGLGDRVVSWGYADEAELGSILAASDLGVAPRYPTAGETSAAVLRFLAAGTPVIVSGYGQFLEFPPAAAPRIPPGRRGVAELARHLVAFAADPARRRAARSAARRAWDEGGHDPRDAAVALLEAVRDLVAA